MLLGVYPELGYLGRMLTPDQFKYQIVDPAIIQFAQSSTSVLHACTVIWGLDALASHVALANSREDLVNNKSKRSSEEQKFKGSLAKSGRRGSWQFQVIREASNALKHGWRKTSHLGAETSKLLEVQDIIGPLWYFEGPENAPKWGSQVVVILGLIFDSDRNRWLDSQGAIFQGPFTNWVPLIGLISPTVEILGFPRGPIDSVIGSDWET